MEGKEENHIYIQPYIMVGQKKLSIFYNHIYTTIYIPFHINIQQESLLLSPFHSAIIVKENAKTCDYTWSNTIAAISSHKRHISIQRKSLQIINPFPKKTKRPNQE